MKGGPGYLLPGSPQATGSEDVIVAPSLPARFARLGNKQPRPLGQRANFISFAPTKLTTKSIKNHKGELSERQLFCVSL